MFSILAIPWLLHDQRRRNFYHILLGHGSGRHFDLDGPRAFAKSVGMIFLSHRNLNIPLSLNNPVLGSKIVGKTEREKSNKVRIMTD